MVAHEIPFTPARAIARSFKMKIENPESKTDNSPALYRAVWRWHFFAGIFVAPFAIFLAITGALYLWKPQFEEWKYRDLFNVTVPAGTAPLSVDAQFAAGRAVALWPDLSLLPTATLLAHSRCVVAAMRTAAFILRRMSPGIPRVLPCPHFPVSPLSL